MSVDYAPVGETPVDPDPPRYQCEWLTTNVAVTDCLGRVVNERHPITGLDEHGNEVFLLIKEDPTPIFNLALAKLGERQIASYGEDSSYAQIMREVWDDVRREVLRTHPWQAATEAAHFDVPCRCVPDGRGGEVYSFDLPVCCLRVLEVSPRTAWWRVAGKTIESNAAEIFFRYTGDVQIHSNWDQLLRSAVVCKLAWKASMRLSRSAETAAKLEQDFQKIMMEAAMVDSTEGDERSARTDGNAYRAFRGYASPDDAFGLYPPQIGG